MASRLTRTALLLLLAIGLLAGCGRASTPDAPASVRPGGELVASLRSEPGHYNRYFEASAAVDLLDLLTNARLIRIDRATDAVEPGLAESWTTSADGRQVTLRLRRDVRFSDGAAFSAADVLFSLDAAYTAPGSRLAPALLISGSRLEAEAPDSHTVLLRFPAAYAPGVRILDSLPILPRHRLEPAHRAGALDKAWTAATPPGELAGLGPFVLVEHVAGQRLVFDRNPHYWRTAPDGTRLPYLDRLRVEIVPEQNAEALRLESGATDLMANGDIRPDDYARFKRLSDQGRLRLVDGGTGLDPNLLWFNLRPAPAGDARPWLHRKEFRQALSFAVDRHAIANAVYLGAAVPVFGPVTPRNATWYAADAPVHPHDPARARQLLAAAGLTDRNGDGLLEDAAGAPARFSVLVQQGMTIRERTAAILQEQLRRVGITVDVVGLDLGAIVKRWQAGEYDSILHGMQASATDPAMNLDFWLSSGNSHLWHPGQSAPATDWERRIDELMRRQASTTDLPERQRLFAEVQQIFGEHLPALYFVAPKVTLAMSPRVANASPAPQIPQVLWSADTLAVSR